MNEVNKIVTIEQLKKAIQDYFKNITKEKILDHYLTDDDIDALYAEHLKLTYSVVENLEESLKAMANKGWLDDKLK